MTLTAEPTTLTAKQAQWLQDLRELADFLEANPELIHEYEHLAIDVFLPDGASLAAMAMRLGGQWEKKGNESFFELVRYFGKHYISLDAHRDRVCTRVEVGTETVEVPDPNAPKVTVTRPVFEWQCPESLLALASEDA